MQVSSESGWSPNPELLARRQYVRTKWGWFPKEDAFGGGESSSSFVHDSCHMCFLLMCQSNCLIANRSDGLNCIELHAQRFEVLFRDE